MFDVFHFSGWGLLVHLAALTQVLGYLLRDQLKLRFLLLVGTCLYCAYYYLYPETLLWDAMFWNAVMITANIVVMGLIVRDRTLFAMGPDQLRLYGIIGKIPPGEFRRLMRCARFRRAGIDTRLTGENEWPDRLFFVMEGPVDIAKNGRSFRLDQPAFIGEVSFLMDRPASATVTVPPGTLYVSWDRAALTKLLDRHPTTRLALEALLNRDMAFKILNS